MSPQPPRNAFVPSGIRVLRDLPYVPGGGLAQSLDLYLPQSFSRRACSRDAPAACKLAGYTNEPSLPLLLWIHGGAFMRGSKENPGPAIHFVNRGYALASIAYRFSQVARFPAQIQDVQAALRWLRAHAGDYGIDAQRVGAWGSSAGGMLANLLGAASGAFPAIGEHGDQDDRVQAVCAYCGPTDITAIRRHAHADPKLPSLVAFNSPTDPHSNLIGVPLGECIAKERAASPRHHLRRRDDHPAWLLVHGTADQHVPYAQATDFAAALREVGAPVLLQPLPGGDHKTPQYYMPMVMDLVQRFFDRSLKGSDVAVEVLPEAAVSLATTHRA